MSWANQFAHRVAFERDELDKAQFDLPHIDQLKQEFQPSHGYSKVQQLLHEALREAGAAGLGTVLTPLLIRVRDAHADLLSHYPDDHDYEEHCAALFDLIDHLALLPSNRTPNSVADGHTTWRDWMKTIKQTVECRGNLAGPEDDVANTAKLFIRRIEEISTECPECELLRKKLLELRSSRAFLMLDLLLMSIGFFVSFYFLCLISKH